MTLTLEIDDSQLVKLGSIARHVEELIEEGYTTTEAGSFDMQAILSLLSDPEVHLFMEYMDKMALLPVKR